MEEISLTGDDPVYKAVKSHLGYTYLYPYQILIISMILESSGYYGEDRAEEACLRNIAVLPTGYGKSVCFMVPALLLSGITLIIYPLKSLINDQMGRFKKAGIPSVTYHGGLSQSEKVNALSEIMNEGTSVILTNPESFLNTEFVSVLKESSLKRIFIDEAHTVTEWGFTFRPSFMEMGRVIQTLNDCSVTALTATAGKDIIDGIKATIFNNERAHVVQTNPNKTNIHYSIRYSLCKDQTIESILKNTDGPALVFCASRTSAEITALKLRRILRRKDIYFYHAGLSENEKTKVEDWFADSHKGILCATCAFGLGIDISGIRTVIHRTLPPTPEAFLQETGRGGRDGKQAHAYSIITPQDIKEIHSRGKSRISMLLDLFLENNCRRSAILSFFEIQGQLCSGCDVCDDEETSDIHAIRRMLKWYKKMKPFFSSRILGDMMYREQETICSYPMLTIPEITICNKRDTNEIISNLSLASRAKYFN